MQESKQIGWLFGIAAAGAVAATAYGFSIDLTRAEWPGWLQAGGSLLTLAVAFGVVGIQNAFLRDQELSRQVDHITQRFVAFIAIGQALIDAAQPINDLPGSPDGGTYHFSLGTFKPESLQIFVEELEALRVGDLPTRQGIEAALNLRSACKRAVESAVAAQACVDHSLRTAYETQLSRSQMALDSASEAIKALKAELVRAANAVEK